MNVKHIWQPAVKQSFGNLKIRGERKKKQKNRGNIWWITATPLASLQGQRLSEGWNPCSPQQQTLWRAERVLACQALPISDSHVLGDGKNAIPFRELPQVAIVLLPLHSLIQLMSVGSYRCFKSFVQLLLLQGQYINSSWQRVCHQFPGLEAGLVGLVDAV